MSTTTVFESPTALGAKIITISTTITNTSGAYSAIITDERLTASMKAIKLELGDPSVFDAVINVAVNNGSLTISCASVTGTSTAVISVLKTCDDPTAITTTEFDVLANRIGDLEDLETTAKTDLVSAVNENSTAIANNTQAIAKAQNGLAYIVGNTNTTGGTLAVGQFVYVKGHSTIAEGLRTVTASISANGNITTSNTSACSDGGLNALNSKIKPVSQALTSNDHIRYTKSGSVVTLSFWWASKAELTAMTMPTGLRPQRQMYFPATILIGSTYSTGTLAISESGTISAIAPTAFDNCFSEITYVAFN